MGYRNGESLGVMFEDLYDGTYYPAASLYMGARVKFNFGPDFKYPPKDLEYQPVSDAVHEHNAQLALSDIVGKVVNGLEIMKGAEPTLPKTETK